MAAAASLTPRIDTDKDVEGDRDRESKRYKELERKALLISARREEVIQTYNAARARNQRQYIEGNVKATREYIYPNQIEDANKIVDIFYTSDVRVVSVQKRTKVGADGLMIEIAKIMTTYIDDDFVIDHKNVRIITGMSNIAWERDMIDKAPTCFKENIFHHGKLSKTELTNLKNGLIIIDEIDSGDKEEQILHATLKSAGILDIEYMKSNNLYFVFISATMLRELRELYKWGDELHANHRMTIPTEYIGHGYFLERGIIKEFYALDTLQKAEKWIQEDILDHYGADFRVHMVRLNPKGKHRNVDTVQDACIRKGVAFYNHTSNERKTEKEMIDFFEKPLTKHIVIGILGFFRRANLIPDEWKLRIGALHELYTNTVDNNVQIQGLPGRMTGYWRDKIEGGHKTGPYRTSIQAVKEYEAIYDCPDDKTKKYKTASYTPFVSPRNFENLEVEEDIPTYRITNVFTDLEKLYSYLEDHRTQGKITKYRINTDGDEYATIQYRGNPRKLLVYETADAFEKLDIYWGINKKLDDDNISCRIMPIMHQGALSWIGIYLVAAFTFDTSA
jgi:hypothetical protein